MTREFGATAWGRAWLRQIEPILIAGDPDRDLVRARSLARRAIDGLCIDGHRVTARLTERGREHVIVLDIPTWTDASTEPPAKSSQGSTPPTAATCPTISQPHWPQRAFRSPRRSTTSKPPATPTRPSGTTFSRSATPSPRESTKNPS
ncbi:hypothetical protein CSW53_27455 (plasmid) [Rhodococcus ruber]|nr:hypothetical protein CSW53_27455 [Rhodococcus ruber]